MKLTILTFKFDKVSETLKSDLCLFKMNLDISFSISKEQPKWQWNKIQSSNRSLRTKDSVSNLFSPLNVNQWRKVMNGNVEMLFCWYMVLIDIQKEKKRKKNWKLKNEFKIRNDWKNKNTWYLLEFI